MGFFSSTPAPAANGNNKPFNQAELNTASKNLQIALSKIANQHVRRYAKEIKNAAIAKARNGYVPQANLNRLKAAEATAKAALKTVPTATTETQTNNSEVEAINSVGMLIRNIQNSQTINYLNRVKNNVRFAGASNANKLRITQAVNTKRQTLESIL